MIDKRDGGENTDLIAMRVAELRRTITSELGTERFALILEDAVDRRLPVWIGSVEAAAAAPILEGIELPRPGVYEFAAALIAGAGAQLREVRIIKLTSSVFYAQAILSDGPPVDARPSDAIILAVLTGAPIYVSGMLSGLLSEPAGRGSAGMPRDTSSEP